MPAKRLVAITCVSMASLLCGWSDAGTPPPGTGLVTITRPTGGQVAIRPGDTQVKVHLQVAFGQDLAGVAANPSTFTAHLTGMSPLLLMPLFTDVKDVSGNVVGKKADVTLPMKNKYTFKAQVFSVIPPGATKAVKGSVKTSFVPVVVPPGPPVIQNFRVANPVGATSDGKPLVNVNEGVAFQADLGDPDGDLVVSYSLDPGDGSAPIAKQSSSGLMSLSESVVYLGSGDFTATLTVTDSDNQSATQTLVLHVNAPPVAKLKINPGQGTFQYPVVFDAVDSNDPDGDALTYTFDFGDGSTPVSGTSNVVTHTYPNPGKTKVTYAVSLTVTDAYGVAATIHSSLVVTSSLTGKPLLNITSPLKGEIVPVTNGVLSVDVALGKASSGADPDPTTFRAMLNRVNVTSFFTPVTDPKRNNAVVGMHGNIPSSDVKMGGLNNNLQCRIKSALFTTAGGTTRTISDTGSVAFTAVTVVLQPPTASFTVTPPEAKVNDTVTFDGSGSRDPQGKPLTYAWDFGDGATVAASSAPTATHAYAAAGTYAATLTVSNGPLNATATSQVVVQAVVTGGNPTLTVSVPQSSGNSLDFGDLDGTMNVSVTVAPTSGREVYPAWVEKCVEITNTGTGTLTVSSLSIDNSSFQVRNAADVQAKSLAAGESDFIDVRFNPRPYTPPNAPPPASPGPQAGTLTIVTNDAASTGTQTVALAGNVVSGVSVDAIRLMRSDMQRVPDDAHAASGQHQPGNASVLDMGAVPLSKSFLFGGVVNEGASGAIIGVDVVDDQGLPSSDFSAKLVLVTTEFGTVNVYAKSTIPMSSGVSLEDMYWYSPLSYGYYVQVTFHPTNTAKTQQRLSARMLLHTYSGVDQVVGLTGIGLDIPYYAIANADNDFHPIGDFEFTRTGAGSRVSTKYDSSNIKPAVLRVTNIGRQAGTVTPSILGIKGGAAPTFSVSPASLTLNPADPTQDSGMFTVTFAPPAAGHYAGVLKIDPGVYQPSSSYLLHGYCNSNGGVGVLGTSRNWYTYWDSYPYDSNGDTFTAMISLENTGHQSAFSQLDNLVDPFVLPNGSVSNNTNAVGMSQYSNPDWSSLVLLAGREFTIDGSVLGPYSLTNPDGTPNADLNNAGKARLTAGQPIYSGAIESRAAFVPGIDGHVDIQSNPTSNDPVAYNGGDPIRLDVTPDNILFYTSVSSNPLSAPTSVIVTALNWKNLATNTGGVVTPDVVAALGGSVPANDEVLDMRVIKLASGGYRAFFVFDDSDASGNQIVADMDLSSSFAVTAHKGLTGTLGALSEANAEGFGNQPIIIDANGLSYTSATVQNADGTATMKVFREDLHAGTGATTGPALFGSVTVNFGDADQQEVLLDNQGNAFLMTNDGICAFSPTGTFLNYILAGMGHTYYADNFAGGSLNGQDTQDLSDFNAVWLDK